MCGGTSCSPSFSCCGLGLSPRVRGNPPIAPSRGGWRGSIPACAGEPVSCNRSKARLGVYPRVCGGTSSSLRVRGQVLGLSPRVRGNQSRSPRQASCPGSIPACAGEPRRRPPRPSGRRVYPRVCGGTAMPGRGLGQAQGLSPRVRGNQAGGVVAFAGTGSIPACAGEPMARIAFLIMVRVYPRVCGGTLRRRSKLCRVMGLSPRVRGNRSWRQHSMARNRVYPRVCGGTCESDCVSKYLVGLSPRVRGNLYRITH